jgi:hypothetical protein
MAMRMPRRQARAPARGRRRRRTSATSTSSSLWRGACALRWARTPAEASGARRLDRPARLQAGQRRPAPGCARRAWQMPCRCPCPSRRPVLGICGGLQMLGTDAARPAGSIDGEPYEQLPGPGPAAAGHPPCGAQAAARGAGALWRAAGALGRRSDGARRCRATRSAAGTHRRDRRPAVLHADDGRPSAGSTGRCSASTPTACSRSPAVLQALLGVKGRGLDERLDGLADLAEAHFEPHALSRLLDPRSSTITSVSADPWQP